MSVKDLLSLDLTTNNIDLDCSKAPVPQWMETYEYAKHLICLMALKQQQHQKQYNALKQQIASLYEQCMYSFFL